MPKTHEAYCTGCTFPSISGGTLSGIVKAPIANGNSYRGAPFDVWSTWQIQYNT